MEVLWWWKMTWKVLNEVVIDVKDQAMSNNISSARASNHHQFEEEFM